MHFSLKGLFFNKYLRIPSDRALWSSTSSDKLDDEGTVLRLSQSYNNNTKSHSTLRPLLSVSLILNLCLVVLLGWHVWNEQRFTEKKCLRSLMLPSPALEALTGTTNLVKFNGSFGGTSEWRGPPSDDIDKQWKSISELGMIPLTSKAARDMGINPDGYAHIPPELRSTHGEGILVGMEFSHQLHCLNMMRKYVNFDYYRNKPTEVSFNTTRHVLQVHIEHCIDILRQVITCQPDIGFWPVYWVDGRDLAMPDFSTQHKCKDFDKVLDWARRHTIKESFEAKPAPGDRVWPLDQHPQM